LRLLLRLVKAEAALAVRLVANPSHSTSYAIIQLSSNFAS
jgi:hypothetical protein